MPGKKIQSIFKLLRDLLIIRPCRNEKGEGNCVRKECKSHIMIISAKILYVYWQ